MSQPDSLVKRLAGPSTGKAGVKQDQTEINRIIAEASKGSKFYENEKRKDKELTEKIEKLLKTRDGLLKTADIPKLEAAADKLIEELESHRDLSQSIVHVDLDSFYASVEVLDDPSLAGKAFGVGYGVLSTASYEARKYGVRSAMPGFIAKKLCPDLIFVKAHYDRYIELSRQVMDILRLYDPNMCVGGMDEAYMNITQYCSDHDQDAQECVSEIRQKVFDETKLTISAGIAPNTMLAKICSDRNKPNGQFYLPPERQVVLDFTRDLSIRKIPGIGRISERLLDSIGIKTCGDVYKLRATVSLMDKQFGLRFLLKTYLGLGSTVVEPGRREERKSVGCETTFNAISSQEKILEKLNHVATELEGDLERTGWAGKTITLKYKLDSFKVYNRAKSMSRWITKKEDLFEIGRELLMAEMPLTLRLIGLRVTRLKDLRAPETGIKRFFQDAATSPNKKAKHKHPADDEEVINVDEDDVMPGYHEEMEEQNMRALEEDLEGDEHLLEQKPLSTRSTTTTKPESLIGRKPVSTNSAKPPTSKGDTSRPEIPMVPERWGLKPTSKSEDPSEPSTSSAPTLMTKVKQPPKQTHLRKSAFKKGVRLPPAPSKAKGKGEQCPICGKVLYGDNAATNAHVDWCLSRDVIKEAAGAE